MDIKSKKQFNNNYQKQESNNKALCRLERKIEKLMYIVSTVTVAPCVIILIIWVFLITAYVVGRKFFNFQWIFVEEFTGYMMVFVAYFSQAYVLRIGGHIKVNFVFKGLTNKIQSILELSTSFLAFTLICYLTWRSIHWFSYGFEHKLCSSTLHIVLWPSYLTVTIGLSLFAFELALNLCLKVIKFMEINVSDIGINDVTKIS